MQPSTSSWAATRRDIGSARAHPAPTALSALLAHADIRINGDRPWDLQVHHPRMYRRILTG